MAALLKETGVETLSLAPEAGSQRLREVIRKGISEEEIFSAVDNLMEYGIVNLRLYFMVGLPTETDEDIEAIIRLVKGMEHRARRSSGGRKGFRRLTLSINQFIPKPATPFQWHPLEDVAVVKRRIRRIADGLRGEKAVSVTHDLPKWNYIQALLSLGDRRVGKLLAGGPPARGQLGAGLPGGEREPRLLRLPPEGDRGDPALGFHRPGRRKGRSRRGIPVRHCPALPSRVGTRLINRSNF